MESNRRSSSNILHTWCKTYVLSRMVKTYGMIKNKKMIFNINTQHIWCKTEDLFRIVKTHGWKQKVDLKYSAHWCKTERVIPNIHHTFSQIDGFRWSNTEIFNLCLSFLIHFCCNLSVVESILLAKKSAKKVKPTSRWFCWMYCHHVILHYAQQHHTCGTAHHFCHYNNVHCITLHYNLRYFDKDFVYEYISSFGSGAALLDFQSLKQWIERLKARPHTIATAWLPGWKTPYFKMEFKVSPWSLSNCLTSKLNVLT